MNKWWGRNILRSLTAGRPVTKRIRLMSIMPKTSKVTPLKEANDKSLLIYIEIDVTGTGMLLMKKRLRIPAPGIVKDVWLRQEEGGGNSYLSAPGIFVHKEDEPIMDKNPLYIFKCRRQDLNLQQTPRKEVLSH